VNREFRRHPEMAHYSATKTMQLGIARSLAELTKGTEVIVNSVLPGPTRTESVEKFIQDVFPDLPAAEAERRFMVDNRPTSLIGRLIDPKEIGDIAAFVCSTRASVIMVHASAPKVVSCGQCSDACENGPIP
jgi:3-oxoacyl-[acyl-carrier protein] reductase